MFTIDLSKIDFTSYSAVSNAIEVLEGARERYEITLEDVRNYVLEMRDYMSDLALDDMPATLSEMAEAFKLLNSSACYYAVEIEASIPEIVYLAL